MLFTDKLALSTGLSYVENKRIGNYIMDTLNKKAHKSSYLNMK